MLDAMFYKARTGCLWEELPERFGPWKGIPSRWRTSPTLYRRCALRGGLALASWPRKERYPRQWACPLLLRGVPPLP
ncbi:transposase [Streptomyces sp. NPDC007157]|uniref:transposase n=1 Tax=Streptomyces sp. NPDC007157 TaxID=3154681 RepID=UPI0033CE7BA1